MRYQKFTKRPQRDHLILGALGGLGGLHPEISKNQANGGGVEIVTLTPPKVSKPPKVRASVTAEAFCFGGALNALEAGCPDFIEPRRWQQCLLDAQHFLGKWGDKALALGWTAQELFGLHEPLPKPHASYSRLSRYDATGLLWLLQGRSVIALTDTTATISTPSGGTLTYRKYRKPALGPLGDSLDDLS
jgi:hypothetical protein